MTIGKFCGTVRQVGLELELAGGNQALHNGKSNLAGDDIMATFES
jgi:hypothetical protein